MSTTILRRAAAGGFYFGVRRTEHSGWLGQSRATLRHSRAKASRGDAPAPCQRGIAGRSSFLVVVAAAAASFGPSHHKALAWLMCLSLLLNSAMDRAHAEDEASGQVVHQLQSQNETLELTVNTSRILTIGKELPRVIVNNPEIAEVTALSPTHIQVMAKKPGVTQINLFSASEGAQAGKDEDEIHTVDLIVYPDARELSLLLRTQFPTAALKVVPTANSVIISGYVDDPSQVKHIIDIATDYAPKVLNNIKVGGVQQVLLQIKVMEVSRTKLRNMGFDWSSLGKSGQGFATDSVGGLLNTLSQQTSTSSTLSGAITPLGRLTTASGNAQSMTFGVMSGSNQFFGVLNFLTQKNVAKVVAEPQLVTVSGRPASFHVGGKVPYAASVSLAGPSFSFMPIGTQIDFVPIVLGNGGIRLEVRPRVSEIDPSNSQTYNGYTIPGFAERQCDTGVELRAGQTLALAGLVQVREEGQSSGLVWISELPILGIPFRSMQHSYNEIETLIMVTPQLVDAMEACETPLGGPGYATTAPDDNELYCKAHIEVPNLKGPNSMGPYPDPHGVFPPISNGAWDEDAKPKAGGMIMAPPVKPARGPVQKEARGTSDSQSGFVDRPQPPSLSSPGASKTNSGTKTTSARKTNTAGFVRFEAEEPAAPVKPTIKSGSSRQKKKPGFIGPTGYDLR